MEEIKAQKVNVVKKPSLPDTLKALPIGIPIEFNQRDFKLSAARNCISDLRKKKFQYDITEKGMVDTYIVTRKA